MRVPTDKRPVVEGPIDGNVFAVLAAARATLQRHGQTDAANDMVRRVMHGEAHSYGQALLIIQEYVRLEL